MRRRGVKRRGEKRKRGPPLEKRRMNRRKRPIDSTDNPARRSSTSDNSHYWRYCQRNECAVVRTCIGQHGDYARQRRQFHCRLRYSFFSLHKAFPAPAGTIALNNRFITRKRPFMNSTAHFYAAFCPTLSLIPRRVQRPLLCNERQ